MMKSFLHLQRVLACVVGLMILVACAPGGPAGVAEDFLESIDAGDVDRTIDLLVPASAEQWGKEKIRAALVEMTRAMQQRGGIERLEILEEQEVGDVASIEVEVTYGDETKALETIDLVRVDGDWKVQPKLTK